MPIGMALIVFANHRNRWTPIFCNTKINIKTTSRMLSMLQPIATANNLQYYLIV